MIFLFNFVIFRFHVNFQGCDDFGSRSQFQKRPWCGKKTCFCFGTTPHIGCQSPPGLNPNLNLYLPLLLGGGLQLKLF